MPRSAKCARSDACEGKSTLGDMFMVPLQAHRHKNGDAQNTFITLVVNIIRSDVF